MARLEFSLRFDCISMKHRLHIHEAQVKRSAKFLKSPVTEGDVDK
jgi:hypothetical protein